MNSPQRLDTYNDVLKAKLKEKKKIGGMPSTMPETMKLAVSLILINEIVAY